MSKQKFYFRIQPQGLSVKCSSSFLADADKLPPLYLSVQKGSHSASTSSVQLTSSRYKPGCFSASWKSHDVENMVEMTLPVTRRSSGKGYEPKEVKVSVKFEEAATGKQQSLASCKFDVTTLNLAKKKSERKVLELIPSKTASDAFKSVSVVMTIAHELADASAAALDSGSERSGSVSPPNYLAESFVQGIKKAGVVGTKAKATSSGGTENGQIHHLPTAKQEQPTSKQQQLTTSKQEQSTSKQEQSTSKHEESTSKQEESTSKQEQSKTKHEQSTRQESTPKEQDDEEFNKQQHQQTGRQQQQLQQKVTEGQQKHDSIGNHSKQSLDNISDTGPCMSSVVEPMEHNHANATMDAWQSEQPHQDDKSKIIETNTRASENEKIDDGTSPVSSDSVTSPGLVHCKESVSDDDLAALQNDGDRLGQLANQTSYSHDLSRLTPRKRAISVDVLTTTTETSKTPIYFQKEEPTPSRYRSHTVLGEPKRKAPPIPANKSPSTQNKRPISTYSSLSDLRRPVQSSITNANISPSTQKKRPVSTYSSLSDLRRPVQGSVTSSSSLSTSSTAYYGKFDILGVLRVRLRGVSIPDNTTDVTEAPPPQVNPLYPLKPRSVSAGAMAIPEATHGIYCVFTINGGNTSAKSETCKVLPYRPVLWGEDEKEKLFFTNHSKQLFILCRKVPLKKKPKAKGSSEVCVGASVMKIIEVTPTLPEQKVVDFTSSDGLQWYNKTLSLQPKGEIELSVSFNGLTPRYKVTCNGIITVMKVNGIDCQPDVDLSCTVKLDSDMLDSTNVYTVEECVVDGWYDEPINFKAKKSLDLVVQIWAYSDDGSANWCGLSMLPLATILHQQDVHKTWAMTPTGGKDREVFVYHENERTITCPVEPQGTIELKVKVFPDEKIKGQDFVPIEISGNHTPTPVVINTTATNTTTNTTSPPPVTIPAPTAATAAAAVTTTNTAVTTNAVVTNIATTTTATATTAASSKEKSTTATTATTTTATTTAKATASTTVSTASENKKQEDNQIQKGVSEADSDGAEPTLKRQGTLRRKFNIHRGKQNDDKPPEPQVRSVDELRQENIDLKREVEYLREQLRMVKAKLADSEFHKEKAEAELRTIGKHKEEKKRTRIFSFGRK